jgi:hypothetical protein
LPINYIGERESRTHPHLRVVILEVEMNSPSAASTAHDAARRLLRHTIASLAHRGGKAVRNAPPGFAEFHAVEGTRTPAEILAHIGDLLDWGLSLAKGKEQWHDSPPLRWDQEVSRFFKALAALDQYLSSGDGLLTPAEKLFQGPIADAFTHVGQIAMLRRMSGSPVRGENYLQADIIAASVGP